MQNTKMDQFQEKWIPVENEIERIREMKVLPLRIGDREWTDDLLRDTIRKLKDDKFTISICGAVKAGKSTFLNSLLFGREVLPAFDTPLTAKLTFIEYTDRPSHFTASFYSKKEWNEYSKTLSSEAQNDLQRRMEISAGRGVHSQIIGSVPRTSDNLSELEMYVSDPESCEVAKYTPYVKNIHIYINDKSIRNFRIVDTPGLNDSNVINSRETCMWIKNTHAMIFLLHCKGADMSDIEFFDQNLSQATPESRIFVINKIDTLSDIDADSRSVIAHLRELGRSGDFAKRNGLFGPKEVICRYSALIAMLRAMQENGDPLNEAQREKLSFKRFRDFNPDPENIRNEIQQRLYNNAGKIRIGSGIKTILEIYEQKIRDLKSQIIQAQAICEDCDKSIEELEQEISAFRKVKDDFHELQGDVKQETHGDFASLTKSVRATLDKGLNHLLAITPDNCDSAAQMKSLAIEFSRILSSEITGATSPFSMRIGEIPYEINGIMKEASIMVKRFYINHGISDSVIFDQADFKFPAFSLDNLGNDLKAALEKALPGNFITEIFYRKSTMRESTRGALSEAAEKVLAQFDGAFRTYNEIIDQYIKEQMNKLADAHDKRCKDKQERLDEDQNARKEKKEENLELIKTLTETVEKLEEAKRAFKIGNPV